MIYLLTAFGLSPGGSSTVPFTHKQYTERYKTINTQNSTTIGECGPCPILASYTLAFALQPRKITENLSHNKENNTAKKLLTYKIMPKISSWLRVTKKYKNMPLSYPKHKSTHAEPARTLWACLRTGRKRISPPSLDVILAQVNCSSDQIRVASENTFRPRVGEKL
jgi:hypothetical protein